MLLIKILLCLPITLGTKFIIINMVFKAVHQPHLMSFSLSFLTFLPAWSPFISSKMSFISYLKDFMHGVSTALVSSEKSHIHLSDLTLNVTCSQGSHLTIKQCLVLFFFSFFFLHTHAYRKVHISKE